MNRYTGRTFALELVLIAVAAIFMVPILVLISVALRDPNSTPGFLGFTWPLHFENISTASTASAMGPSLVNSIVITTVSVALIIVVASAASYTITRRTQRWSAASSIFS